MKIDILTLFPEMFESPFSQSIVGRAVEKGVAELETHSMRQWAWNSYGAVDDRPYGGGVGMLIRVDVIDKALEEIKSRIKEGKSRIILTGAGGKKFDQKKAEELSKFDNLIFICGHYEGFDERIKEMLIDEELSIGDYVLTGGELPAMVMIDATVRLLPGVLGKNESSQIESFSETEIEGKKVRIPEYPQYTRPFEFKGKKVPQVLLSGDPKKIKEWQIEKIKSGLLKDGSGK